jgi:hypothetical protein
MKKNTEKINHDDNNPDQSIKKNSLSGILGWGKLKCP